MSIPNSDPFENEEELAALDTVYWEPPLQAVNSSPPKQEASQDVYVPVASTSKVTLEDLLSPSPPLQSQQPRQDAEEAMEFDSDGDLPPPLSFSDQLREVPQVLDLPEDQLPLLDLSSHRQDEAMDVDLYISPTRSQQKSLAPASAVDSSPLSIPSLSQLHDERSPQVRADTSATSPGLSPKANHSKAMSSPESLPTLSQIHPAATTSARRSTSISNRMSPEPTPSRTSAQASEVAPTQQPTWQIPPEEGYKRSFRQRAPKQLMPYSIEQAGYIHALNKNQWEDAVVKVRTADWTAEELAARKAQQLAVGQDDLEGWLKLERGMSKRAADDPEHAPPIPREALSSTKRKRATGTSKELEKDKALRRALGGQSDVESSEEDLSIPAERSTPKQKRKRPMQSATASRQSHSRARAGPGQRYPDQNPSNENHSRRATVIQPSKKASTSKQYTTIDTSDGSATVTSGSDDPGGDPVAIGPSSKRSHSGASGMPERFKLEGKRKKHLRGMMPGSFLKKAETDLRLMAQERRTGQKRPELLDFGSGDEEGNDDLVEEAPDRYRSTVKRKRPARSPRDIHDVETLTVDDSSATATASEEDVVTGRQAVRAREVAETDSEQEELQAVASWLVGDLPAQTSKRSRGSDLIDRLLARSRQQPAQRKKTQKKNVARRKKARRIDEVSLSDPIAENQSTAVKSSKQRSRKNGTSLADPNALFANFHIPPADEPPIEQNLPHNQQHRQSRIDSRANTPIPPVDIDMRPPAERSTSSVSPWLRFNQFSYDFDLLQLPPGTTLAANSPIRNGDVVDLIQSLSSASGTSQAQPAIAPFGILLDWNIDSATLISLLPRIFDQYRDTITSFASDLPDHASIESLVSLLDFAAQYMTKQFDETAVGDEIWAALDQQLQQTDQVLDSLDAPEPKKRTLLCAALPIQWAVIKITLRLRKRTILLGNNVGIMPSPGGRIRRVVRDLIKCGPNETGESIKSAAKTLSFGESVDNTVEIWTSLLLLVLDKDVSSEPAFEIPSTEAFWKLMMEELEKANPSHNSQPLIAIESICYMAMLLCCLSQVSVSGVSTAAGPKLPAYWPVVNKALDLLKNSQLQQNPSSSRLELARRDGYLWTILARVLTFNRRWCWRLDSKNGITVKLYDLLNHTSLANLAVDRSDEFPDFLQHFTGSLPQDLSVDDSSFTILLKVLSAQVGDLPRSNLADRTKLIARMLARLTPMRKLPFTENDCVLNTDRSVLVHHYSLFMTYTIFSPSTAGQRFAQVRNLLRFEDADDLSKSVQIRAMMHLAKIHRQLGIMLQPLVEWFASACEHLVTQFRDQSKKRTSIMNAPGKTAVKGTSIRMTVEEQREIATINAASGRIAISLTMILRAVQNILLATPLSASDVSQYPDLALLHPSWTSALLNSDFARDPMVGTEVLKCLQCFLNLRSAAIQPKAQTDSFDEFGLDDFDFNDPALNDMIGFQANEDPEKGRRDQDKAFAQLVKEHYSPAIYKLLSAIYTADLPQKGAPPTVSANTQRHTDYTIQLVACWVACTNVLVENDLKSWATYFNFGDESFRRIPDPVGRREVALFFGLELSRTNVAAFRVHLDELLGIWFDTVLLRTISVQHLFTAALLNALPDDHALTSDIAVGKEPDDDDYSFDLASWAVTRFKLLDTVFDNINKILSGDARLGQPAVTSSTVFGLINALAGSMRDSLDACSSQDAQAKADYTAVCVELYRRLKARAGPQVNERTVPNLRLIAGLDAQRLM